MPPLPPDPVVAKPTLTSVMIAGSHPSIPIGARLATRFWGLLSGVVMIGGIVYAFWGGWYWAPIGIVAGMLVEGANRRSAAQFIASTAGDDLWFRSEMLQKGLIAEVARDPHLDDEFRERATEMYWDGEKLVSDPKAAAEGLDALHRQPR